MAELAALPTRFDPSDLRALRSLAWLARCAYYDADRLPVELAKVDLTLDAFVEADGTTAYVASGPTASVVAFRGTEFDELRDIATDLRVKLVDYADGRAHGGFVTALQPIADALRAALPARPIRVVGHSLGGALAQVCAAQLEHPVEAVVSFGSPRVGDAAFAGGLARRLGARLLRVTHDQDPVLGFPPKPLGYRHGGPELRLLNAGGWRRLDGVEPDGAPRFAEVKDDRARRHLIPHYEALLDACVA